MINKDDKVYFKRNLENARSFFLQGKYSASIREYAKLLELLLPKLYKDHYLNLSPQKQQNIIDSLSEDLKGKRISDYCFKDWIEFFEKSNFFLRLEQKYKKEFRFFNPKNLEYIRKERNKCAHKQYTSPIKKARFISKTTDAIMDEILVIEREQDLRLKKQLELKEKEKDKKERRECLEKYLKEMRIILAENSPIKNEDTFILEDKGITVDYYYTLDIHGIILNYQNKFIILTGFKKCSIPEIMEDYVYEEIHEKIIKTLVEKIPPLKEESIEIQFHENEELFKKIKKLDENEWITWCTSPY